MRLWRRGRVKPIGNSAKFTADEIETLVNTAGEAIFGDREDLSERQLELAERAYNLLMGE